MKRVSLEVIVSDDDVAQDVEPIEVRECGCLE